MAVQQVQPEEITRLWERILSAVQDKIESPQAFDTWFRPILPRNVSPQLVELEVPNAFFADWIHQHHLKTLCQGLAEVLGANPEVRFSSPEIAPPTEPRVREPAPQHADVAPRIGRPLLEGQLISRHTFESFVVGSGNRFTHAACLAVAENPGNVYNPLFIFGDSGLGKTHLLHAIGNAVRRSRPDARICYVAAERFTNEMIYAIQHAQTLAFRNKYRNVDVLLIDDIQFLAGKESTQEEFFYTFNALRDAHKQVVVTSDKAPKDIEMLEDRLTSRFNQGLVTDVQMPDLETRMAILHNRASNDASDLHIPEDVLLLIADRIRNNIRDLEGCLVRLIAVAAFAHKDVSLDLAEEVLGQYVNEEPDRTTPERILACIAERFGVKSEALCGQRRTRNVALPRQVAMYLMRQLTDLSLVEIGRVFGGRDHTTVIYACEKIGTMIAADKLFSDKINGLISTLES